jgi:hypothetical protein
MATAALAAKHICLQVARFRDLVAAGVIKRAPSGGYKLDVVRESYIRHMQLVAAGRAADGGESLAKERTRLARAQAESAERKNDVEAGLLVPVKDVCDTMEPLWMVMRERLLSLPGECADGVQPLTALDRGSIMLILRDKVYDALRYLAVPENYPFNEQGERRKPKPSDETKPSDGPDIGT